MDKRTSGTALGYPFLKGLALINSPTLQRAFLFGCAFVLAFVVAPAPGAPPWSLALQFGVPTAQAENCAVCRKSPHAAACTRCKAALKKKTAPSKTKATKTRAAKKSHTATHSKTGRTSSVKAGHSAKTASASKPTTQQTTLTGVRTSTEKGITRLVFDLDRTPRYELNWITPGERLQVIFNNTRARRTGLSKQPKESFIESAEIQAGQEKTVVEIIAKQGVSVRPFTMPKEPKFSPRLVLDFTLGASQNTQETVAPPPPPIPATPSLSEIRDNARTSVGDRRAEEIYQKGVALLRQNDTDGAEKLLRQALQADPSYLPARVVLARQLIDKKLLPEATTVLEAGFATHPYSKKLGKLYVNTLAQQGQNQQALDFLGKIIEREASDPALHALRGNLLQRSNRHEEAVTAFRKALDINPESGVWWAGMGLSLDKQSRHEDALQAYQKAINKEISDPSVVRFVRERIGALEQNVPHGTNLTSQ